MRENIKDVYINDDNTVFQNRNSRLHRFIFFYEKLNVEVDD